MNYLQNVADDFEALGLQTFSAHTDLDISLASPSYLLTQMHRITGSTYGLDQASRDEASVRNPALFTRTGQRVMACLQSDCFEDFISDSSFICCDTAENKLAESLSPGSIAAERFRTPTVIEAEGEAIAVVKTFGEDSCYGLRTVEEFGLLEGVFHGPEDDFYNQLLNLSPGTKVGKIALEAAGKFTPIRFSPLVFEEDSQGRSDHEAISRVLQQATGATHTKIKNRANELLQDAYLIQRAAKVSRSRKFFRYLVPKV